MSTGSTPYRCLFQLRLRGYQVVGLAWARISGGTRKRRERRRIRKGYSQLAFQTAFSCIDLVQQRAYMSQRGRLGFFQDFRGFQDTLVFNHKRGALDLGGGTLSTQRDRHTNT
ncbi:uncharacterized protein LY79DRAFT_140475 [Colletotrichum navitas]|uniref:Uncharacterized protein n=1 Tax=Colletotrichum navitas TaxID=681940 RepID=A0AAD8VAP5_9PEZI|nr:uncharacterized protein LY79DRAFT_140475 [Colletotrichum navitas]KAK1599419.1 hypothetical protein LY79DRAFT_140475 [Colletotrichum navitas]